MILLLLCLLAFTYGNAYYHYYIIEVKKRSPNHNVWALYRITYFALTAYLYSTEASHIIAITLLQAAIFWICFDWWLNVLRDLPWNYIGANAKIDKFFKDKGDTILAAKLIFLFVAGVLTVIVI